MKLLLDANLSWRLTTLLSEHFGECIVGNIDRKTTGEILIQTKPSIIELEKGEYGLLEII
jgi:hypothetical protein